MAGPSEWDAQSLELLEDGLRKTMLSTSGTELDAALAELGWSEMLSDMSEVAIPLVFRLLGETGSHASVLNDVVLLASSPDEARTLRFLRGRRLGGVGLRLRRRVRPWAGCHCAGSKRAGILDCPTRDARSAGGWRVAPGRC